MKKIAVLLMSLAVFTFVFIGCKKYDEGPAFSLASKKGRVVNVWKVEKAFFNGVEQPTTFFSGFSIEYTKDNKVIYTDNGVADPEQDTWEFGDKKETIITKSGTGSGADTTTILRLKSKELWLKSMDGTEEYHLIPN